MSTLFRDLLGAAFDELPEPVRRFHMLDLERFTSGRSMVARPETFGARLLSWIAGLPAPGVNLETSVRFTPLARNREYWRRNFAGRRYRSIMEAATDGRLIEHFGPFDLYFALTPSARGLRWSLREWRLLKFPLPKRSTPSVECLETAEGDAFVFDIDVVFPLIGSVVHYAGALQDADDAAARRESSVRPLPLLP
ncbi:MAG TPA: DUF4166 domain-containing protein [Methylocystis sp.]|nr:DUF4166 domain-containing protein [Methylocystis sp.]